MKTDRYRNREETTARMVSRIEYLHLNGVRVQRDELDLLNLYYQYDRDAAIAFGEDVSDLPRKLKVNTRLPTLQLPI